MSNFDPNLKEILYEDDTVKITPFEVTILKYYFPIPSSKIINMKDIVTVNLRDNVDGQMWGTSPGHMDKWFAYDGDRDKKLQYLQFVIRDSDVKAAFSPSEPLKVKEIVEKYASRTFQQKHEFGYIEPAKLSPRKKEQFSEFKTQFKDTKLKATYNDPTIKRQVQIPNPNYKPISGHVKAKQKLTYRDPFNNDLIQQTIQVTQKPQKGVLQSIGQKINSRVQGIKNVASSLKQKYIQGKQNAYVSPDNRIDMAKDNMKYNAGQKARQYGQNMEQKGKQMQWNSMK